MAASGSGKDAGEHVDEAAVQLLLRAYDNHKNHARFQETQRSGFLVLYMGLVGIVSASLFSRGIESAGLTDQARQIFIAAYAFLLLTGFWTAIAMVKVGVEFRRHFHQAERIVLGVQKLLREGSQLRGLLDFARMGTSGDESTGVRQFFARRFGVGSVHAYLIACVLASEIATLVVLTHGTALCALVSFPVAAVALVILLQTYRKLIYTRSLPE